MTYKTNDMSDCYIGFDTSNYTTSVAVCSGEGKVIANLKAPLPVREGQRGLRQSDAVFEHVRNLPRLTEELRGILAENGMRPRAVGVSVTPRDAEGSYMPCFLSGKAAAYSFAAALDLPVYPFSHQNGHVMAALYSSGNADKLMSDSFVAFHVSGGTTEALLVKADGFSFDVELVGETDDINAGQLIDRIGVAMGLDFPCGREMERLASEYCGRIYSHKVCVKNGRCSLSGAENIALKIFNETADKRVAAAFVFEFVGSTLAAMGKDIEAVYGKRPILFAGGVMSNRIMRKKLAESFDAYFSEPEFSADNAAGISLLCRRAAIETIKKDKKER